tara:strand:- start:10277 stop:10564 length:288 start_codon:yes stop_codon:yes gene_type:complete
MALQGSITFKGLPVPKAYLDIHKIVIDVESMSANMEYKVYANEDVFAKDKSNHLTTHIEVVPVQEVFIDKLLRAGREEAKKDGKKFGGFKDYRRE